RALSGIGAAAERELARHGIETLGGLAASDPSLLRRLFGKNGHVMHIRAQGKDNSPVESESDVKSISNEITFSQDLTTFEEIEAALSSIAAKVGRRLRMKGLRAHTLSLKVRYDDRSLKNIQRRLEHNTDDDLFFTPVLLSMVQEVWKPGMPIRLLGVGMSGFEEEAELQARLFEVAAEEDVSSFREEKPRLNDAQKRSDFLRATDSVRDRFGEDAIRFGHEITTRTRTTGSGAKNPTDYK
ncbi:MAG: hypothetical protein LBB35_02485, partial [Coriobacteriaceae bacterium]|nr:hypothetical protein [Coriobacteriaceae bacterium]